MLLDTDFSKGSVSSVYQCHLILGRYLVLCFEFGKQILLMKVKTTHLLI